MKYLLDTNVISELIAREPNQTVVDWIDSREPSSVYLSVITIGELRKGIEKLPTSRRKDDLTHWLASDLLFRFTDHIVELTVEVMLVWGELVGRLEREGTRMPAIDSLIAASVIAGQFTFVTRNVTDFRYAGIQIINPWNIP